MSTGTANAIEYKIVIHDSGEGSAVHDRFMSGVLSNDRQIEGSAKHAARERAKALLTANQNIKRSNEDLVKAMQTPPSSPNFFQRSVSDAQRLTEAIKIAVKEAQNSSSVIENQIRSIRTNTQNQTLSLRGPGDTDAFVESIRTTKEELKEYNTTLTTAKRKTTALKEAQAPLIQGLQQASSEYQKLIDQINGIVSAQQQLESSTRTIRQLDEALQSAQRSGRNIDFLQRRLDQVEEEARQARAEIQRLTQAINNNAQASDRLKSLVTRYVSLGAAVTGTTLATKKAITTYASFETAISRVGAVAGLSKDQIEEVKRASQELGATTVFSQDDAAAGFLELARAGFSLKESLELIRPAMDLAIAGEVSLGEASSIIAKTMNQFGLEAKDARLIIDELVKAANAGDHKVTNLGYSLAKAGGAAKAVGVNLQDTNLLVTALANLGHPAEVSGTAISIFLGQLKKLQVATGETAEILEKVPGGFDAIDPSANRIIDIIDNLNKAQLEYTEITKILGQEAGPKFATLIGNGAAALETLKGKIEGNSDAATTAKRNLGELDQSFKSFESIATTAFSNVGENLAPLTKDITDFSTEVLRALNDVESNTPDSALKDWAQGTATALEFIASAAPPFAAAVTTYVVASFVASGTAASVASTAVAGFGVALKTAMGPIGWIAAAIGVAIAAWQNWDSIVATSKETVTEAIDYILKNFKGFADFVVEMEHNFKTTIATITYVMETAGPRISNVWLGIKQTVANVLAGVFQKVDEFKIQIVGVLDTVSRFSAYVPKLRALRPLINELRDSIEQNRQSTYDYTEEINANTKSMEDSKKAFQDKLTLYAQERDNDLDRIKNRHDELNLTRQQTELEKQLWEQRQQVASIKTAVSTPQKTVVSSSSPVATSNDVKPESTGAKVGFKERQKAEREINRFIEQRLQNEDRLFVIEQRRLKLKGDGVVTDLEELEIQKKLVERVRDRETLNMAEGDRKKSILDMYKVELDYLQAEYDYEQQINQEKERSKDLEQQKKKTQTDLEKYAQESRDRDEAQGKRIREMNHKKFEDSLKAYQKEQEALAIQQDGLVTLEREYGIQQEILNRKRQFIEITTQESTDRAELLTLLESEAQLVNQNFEKKKAQRTHNLEEKDRQRELNRQKEVQANIDQLTQESRKRDLEVQKQVTELAQMKFEQSLEDYRLAQESQALKTQGEYTLENQLEVESEILRRQKEYGVITANNVIEGAKVLETYRTELSQLEKKIGLQIKERDNSVKKKEAQEELNRQLKTQSDLEKYAQKSRDRDEAQGKRIREMNHKKFEDSLKAYQKEQEALAIQQDGLVTLEREYGIQQEILNRKRQFIEITTQESTDRAELLTLLESEAQLVNQNFEKKKAQRTHNLEEKDRQRELNRQKEVQVNIDQLTQESRKRDLEVQKQVTELAQMKFEQSLEDYRLAQESQALKTQGEYTLENQLEVESEILRRQKEYGVITANNVIEGAKVLETYRTELSQLEKKIGLQIKDRDLKQKQKDDQEAAAEADKKRNDIKREEEKLNETLAQYDENHRKAQEESWLTQQRIQVLKENGKVTAQDELIFQVNLLAQQEAELLKGVENEKIRKKINVHYADLLQKLFDQYHLSEIQAKIDEESLKKKKKEEEAEKRKLELDKKQKAEEKARVQLSDKRIKLQAQLQEIQSDQTSILQMGTVTQGQTLEKTIASKKAEYERLAGLEEYKHLKEELQALFELEVESLKAAQILEVQRVYFSKEALAEEAQTKLQLRHMEEELVSIQEHGKVTDAIKLKHQQELLNVRKNEVLEAAKLVVAETEGLTPEQQESILQKAEAKAKALQEELDLTQEINEAKKGVEKGKTDDKVRLDAKKQSLKFEQEIQKSLWDQVFANSDILDSQSQQLLLKLQALDYEQAQALAATDNLEEQKKITAEYQKQQQHAALLSGIQSAGSGNVGGVFSSAASYFAAGQGYSPSTTGLIVQGAAGLGQMVQQGGVYAQDGSNTLGQLALSLGLTAAGTAIGGPIGGAIGGALAPLLSDALGLGPKEKKDDRGHENRKQQYANYLKEAEKFANMLSDVGQSIVDFTDKMINDIGRFNWLNADLVRGATAMQDYADRKATFMKGVNAQIDQFFDKLQTPYKDAQQAASQGGLSELDKSLNQISDNAQKSISELDGVAEAIDKVTLETEFHRELSQKEYELIKSKIIAETEELKIQIQLTALMEKRVLIEQEMANVLEKYENAASLLEKGEFVFNVENQAQQAVEDYQKYIQLFQQKEQVSFQEFLIGLGDKIRTIRVEMPDFNDFSSIQGELDKIKNVASQGITDMFDNILTPMEEALKGPLTHDEILDQTQEAINKKLESIVALEESLQSIQTEGFSIFNELGGHRFFEEIRKTVDDFTHFETERLEKLRQQDLKPWIDELERVDFTEKELAIAQLQDELNGLLDEFTHDAEKTALIRQVYAQRMEAVRIEEEQREAARLESQENRLQQILKPYDDFLKSQSLSSSQIKIQQISEGMATALENLNQLAIETGTSVADAQAIVIQSAQQQIDEIVKAQQAQLTRVSSSVSDLISETLESGKLGNELEKSGLLNVYDSFASLNDLLGEVGVSLEQSNGSIQTWNLSTIELTKNIEDSLPDLQNHAQTVIQELKNEHDLKIQLLHAFQESTQTVVDAIESVEHSVLDPDQLLEAQRLKINDAIAETQERLLDTTLDIEDSIQFQQELVSHIQSRYDLERQQIERNRDAQLSTLKEQYEAQKTTQAAGYDQILSFVDRLRGVETSIDDQIRSASISGDTPAETTKLIADQLNQIGEDYASLNLNKSDDREQAVSLVEHRLELLAKQFENKDIGRADYLDKLRKDKNLLTELAKSSKTEDVDLGDLLKDIKSADEAHRLIEKDREDQAQALEEAYQADSLAIEEATKDELISLKESTVAELQGIRETLQSQQQVVFDTENLEGIEAAIRDDLVNQLRLIQGAIQSAVRTQLMMLADVEIGGEGITYEDEVARFQTELNLFVDMQRFFNGELTDKETHEMALTLLGNVTANGEERDILIQKTIELLGDVTRNGEADTDVINKTLALIGAVTRNGPDDTALIEKTLALAGQVSVNDGLESKTIQRALDLIGNVAVNGAYSSDQISRYLELVGSVTSNGIEDDVLVNRQIKLLGEVYANGGTVDANVERAVTLLGEVSANGELFDVTVDRAITLLGNVTSNGKYDDETINRTIQLIGDVSANGVFDNVTIDRAIELLGNVTANGQSSSQTLNRVLTLLGDVSVNGGFNSQVVNKYLALTGEVTKNANRPEALTDAAIHLLGQVTVNQNNPDWITNQSLDLIGQVVHNPGVSDPILNHSLNLIGQVTENQGHPNYLKEKTLNLIGNVTENRGYSDHQKELFLNLIGNVTENEGYSEHQKSRMLNLIGNVVVNSSESRGDVSIDRDLWLSGGVGINGSNSGGNVSIDRTLDMYGYFGSNAPNNAFDMSQTLDMYGYFGSNAPNNAFDMSQILELNGFFQSNDPNNSFSLDKTLGLNGHFASNDPSDSRNFDLSNTLHQSGLFSSNDPHDSSNFNISNTLFQEGLFKSSDTNNPNNFNFSNTLFQEGLFKSNDPNNPDNFNLGETLHLNGHVLINDKASDGNVWIDSNLKLSGNVLVNNKPQSDLIYRKLQLAGGVRVNNQNQSQTLRENLNLYGEIKHNPNYSFWNRPRTTKHLNLYGQIFHNGDANNEIQQDLTMLANFISNVDGQDPWKKQQTLELIGELSGTFNGQSITFSNSGGSIYGNVNADILASAQMDAPFSQLEAVILLGSANIVSAIYGSKVAEHEKDNLLSLAVESFQVTRNLLGGLSNNIASNLGAHQFGVSGIASYGLNGKSAVSSTYMLAGKDNDGTGSYSQVTGNNPLSTFQPYVQNDWKGIGALQEAEFHTNPYNAIEYDGKISNIPIYIPIEDLNAGTNIGVNILASSVDSEIYENAGEDQLKFQEFITRAQAPRYWSYNLGAYIEDWQRYNQNKNLANYDYYGYWQSLPYKTVSQALIPLQAIGTADMIWHAYKNDWLTSPSLTDIPIYQKLERFGFAEGYHKLLEFEGQFGKSNLHEKRLLWKFITDRYAKGGHVDGRSVAYYGGMAYGPTHEQGGILGLTPAGPIEFRGNEYILSPERTNFYGKPWLDWINHGDVSVSQRDALRSIAETSPQYLRGGGVGLNEKPSFLTQMADFKEQLYSAVQVIEVPAIQVPIVPQVESLPIAIPVPAAPAAPTESKPSVTNELQITIPITIDGNTNELNFSRHELAALFEALLPFIQNADPDDLLGHDGIEALKERMGVNQ